MIEGDKFVPGRSIEARREMFVGKPALEIVPFLVASIPEIGAVEIVSYQRGVFVAGAYPENIGMALDEGLANSFEVDRKVALSPDYWEKMAEELKEIYITSEYPDGSPVGPEEAREWYKSIKEDIEGEGEVYLSLSSRVRGWGTYVAHRQIPLMDFKCVPSDENLSAVKNLLVASGEKRGIILHSGQSYHYYGLMTLSPGEWRVWIKMWLRNTWIWPEADRKFVTKSLEDGFNFLRLTSGVSKPSIPIVVDVI